MFSQNINISVKICKCFNLAIKKLQSITKQLICLIEHKTQKPLFSIQNINVFSSAYVCLLKIKVLFSQRVGENNRQSSVETCLLVTNTSLGRF